MCYLPNLKHRSCRFDRLVHERKVRRKCVFCGYTRSKRGSLPTRKCPALNNPGHVVIEPSEHTATTTHYEGLTVGFTERGRATQVWVPSKD